jgi:glycosyltransferase involved in cell wall biosynthesis
MTVHPSGPGLQSPPDVLIDARCLQDPNYAGRGIGRHATALLEGARASPTIARGARLTALQDPALPPMSARHRAVFDELRTTAYTGALTRPVWFLQLSPMTHDPLFVARLLHHAAPLTAAVVYDFIPLDDAARYLTDPKARLDYHVALAWLAHYDLFAPISQASAARLGALIPAAAADITVTGAALDPVFEPSAAAPGPRVRSHILVIGGGDPRKNVDCAIRGHAACATLQAAATPLVVTGHYAPSQIETMRTLAADSGGNPALLRTPGHVDDAALAALYRDAAAVVVPSLVEGFSLPVIEAMAAGAPVIASRIAPHSELIACDSLLFPSDAPADLAAILARLHADAALRADIVAAQTRIWPRFRAAEVAGRFWAALERRAAERATPPPAAIGIGRKPRLALVTPVPPERSGVADFSAAGCAALAARTDLHIFTNTAHPLPLAGARSVQPLSALPYLSGGFDRVVSVMGNSEFHLGIHHLLTRYGGACIAHDSHMLGFYSALFGMQRAQEIAGRELGRSVSDAEVTEWLQDGSRLPATLLSEIAAVAEPLIMHSSRAAASTSASLHMPVTALPFATYRTWSDDALQPSARAAARRRLGLPDEVIVIASFGFVTSTKAPADCIFALELLRGWGLSAELHFVGAINIDVTSLRTLARQFDVEPYIVFKDDFMPEATYRDYLLAADLGLQLRSFGRGAVSGALQDCITAGLASVANDDLADAIDAPGYVRRVPDAISPVLVAEALAELVSDGAHKDRHHTARRGYAASHSFDRYAELLCHAIGLEPGRTGAA